MKPLQAIALGLVLLALGPTSTDPGVFDPLPDPLGWIFVLLGVYGARHVVEPARLPLLRLLGIAALVVSVVLVVPDAARWLADEDQPALGWAADVPRFGFFLVLCSQLSRSALAARHTLGASVFSLLGAALVFVLIAPPLAFGAGWDDVGTAGEIAAQVGQLALIVACFSFAGRRWAGAPDPDEPS